MLLLFSWPPKVPPYRANFVAISTLAPGYIVETATSKHVSFQPTNRGKQGVTGVIATHQFICNSTWLLELDKLHDHVTHDVRHRKHFKKQRKPYLSIFIKKPRKTFDFWTVTKDSTRSCATLDVLRSLTPDMHFA